MEPKEIRTPADIRGLPAQFNPQASGHFAKITGTAGSVTRAGDAKVAIMNRWVVERSGARSQGQSGLRFRAQFSWFNEALWNLPEKWAGKPRVRVQMKTRYGIEEIDILTWTEARFEDGILTLENIEQVEGKVTRKIIK